MRNRLLALAVSTALSATAATVRAQDAGPDQPPHSSPAPAAADRHGHRETDTALEAIVVTASPLGPGSDDLVQPVEILAGEELDRRKGATLGETVARELGVQSSYFGPGVGRPIIRGLEGARVQVLEGGMSSLDASTVSADHAVGIEPFLADQIEILKGPATLLYGSGAVGGAVNVVDGRIPEALPESAFGGRAELRGNSVNDEATGMARIDGAVGNFAWHADAFHRDTSDYEIPGHAHLDEAEEHAEGGHEGEEEDFGVLHNSAVRTRGGAIGGSWIGESAFLGVAVSNYLSLYGIPGGGHAHEEGEHADTEEDEEEEEPGHEDVRIDLQQTRVDLRGALYAPWRGIESLRLRVAHNDYAHLEMEGDEVGTRFGNDGHEGRLEAVHEPLAGWRGVVGLQFSTRDFVAIGEEAFVPPTRSEDIGVFLVEERDFGRWKLELGARHDDISVDPEGELAEAGFGASSLSAGALWRATDALHFSVGVDRAERAPTAEELFSNGPHLATAGFEIGDSTLGTETANQLELAAHLHVGPLEAKAAVFDNRYDQFIHLAETGLEEDGLPVRQWTQADARFRGLEAEATLRIADNASGAWDLRLFGDRVRGTLDAGGNLPRIAPARAGLDLTWENGPWRASAGAIRHARQDQVATLETPTRGYTLVDAHLAYHWDTAHAGWELFLDGNNLTDEEARVHTSFLKEVAPLPGRAIAVGVRAFF